MVKSPSGGIGSPVGGSGGATHTPDTNQGSPKERDRDRDRDRDRHRDAGKNSSSYNNNSSNKERPYESGNIPGNKPLTDEPEVMTSPLTKENIENLEMKSMSVRRIADYTKNLRDNIEDILEERDNNKSQLYKCARKFRAFALDGDLKQGLSLLEDFESVKNPKQLAASRQSGEVGC